MSCQCQTNGRGPSGPVGAPASGSSSNRAPPFPPPRRPQECTNPTISPQCANHRYQHSPALAMAAQRALEVPLYPHTLTAATPLERSLSHSDDAVSVLWNAVGLLCNVRPLECAFSLSQCTFMTTTMPWMANIQGSRRASPITNVILYRAELAGCLGTMVSGPWPNSNSGCRISTTAARDSGGPNPGSRTIPVDCH
jgi:hypothetical protein